MPVLEEDVDGVIGLVERVLAIRDEIGDERFLWFRGVRRHDRALVPSILRDGKDSEAIFEREGRLLTRFRQRSLAYWPSGYPQTDWEHMFAMQHYGLPTRLLDWSENLFVAAYFALSSNIYDSEQLPVIWCVDPVNWNRRAPNLAEFGNSIHVLTTADEDADPYRPQTTKRRYRTPVAIFGTHNSQRIVAQRGTFFVWGNETSDLTHFAGTDGPTLWKLRVTGDRDQLAKSMQFLGFGETMVFPELPALGQELARTVGWRS